MNENTYAFLNGGGEMGSLIRNFDWTKTSLGSPAGWQSSLRTTLSIVLHSKFPMFLFWGKDFISFYNDAFRPSLGNDGKHPSVLGMKGNEVWVENWEVVGPMLEAIFDGGEVPLLKDQLLSNYRNGRMEDVYWTFSYSPVMSDSGSVEGVLVTCIETTASVLDKYNISKSAEEYKALVENTPDLISRWDSKYQLKYANTAFINKVGDVVGKDNFQMGQPEQVASEFQKALKRVFESGSPAEHFNVVHTGTTKAYYHMRLVPEYGEDASLTTVLCIARDITSLTESETRFQNLLREATVGLIVLEGEDMVVSVVNDAFGKIIGHTVEAMLNKPLFDVIPKAAAFYRPIVQEVLHTGRNYHLDESPYEVLSETGELIKGYVSLVYQPFRSEGGDVTGVMIVCNDITTLVLAKQKITDSEEKLRGVIAAAPAGIGLFIGRDLVIENPNQTLIDIIGKGYPIEGLPLREAMPELTSEGQPFLKILDNVFTTGVPFVSPASLVKVVQNGVLNDNYYNISYTPLRNSSGEIYGVLDIAIDVTGQVVAQNALEASENRLKGIIEQSPVAMLVMRGDQFIIDQINAPMLALIGQDKSVIGKSLIEVMPELRNEAAWDLTQKIYFEGIDFSGHEVMVTHSRGETISNHFYNLEYRPLREGDKITGVIQVVNDITEQVVARKAVEAKEAALRNATELAQLANWRVNLVTNQAHYSDRLADWVGLKEKTFDLTASSIIHPDDREIVAAGIKLALEPGSSGIFDETYSILHIKTGQRRIIHAIGNVEYDEKGKAVAINGTAQDVTIQMELQVALESEVQKRTEELAAAIEELRATNEELEESNQLLLHSNDELAQYAYVASHDLQEPLRKIRVFTGMLDVDGEKSSRNVSIIQKINTSATRMTLLIQDLLTFSRLLNSDNILREVPLAEIVNAVWDDFELIVDEKKAAIELTSLPVIQAVSLQMNQLFYNLINNALKFTDTERSPVVVVKSSPMSTEEILKFIPKPLSFANYHHITISDNGIGFEMEYYEQIFEVFKRLHARENYPGSGIGLALCRRIVGNHNGFLFAESEIGRGSTFHIILPDRQREE